MHGIAEAGPWQTMRRWIAGTPRRTFVVFPLAIIAIGLIVHRGHLVIEPWGAVLLLWGYLQYRLVGRYRMRLARGGPGIDVPPTKVIAAGPYAFVRNPMYLGHLIFMAGLAVTFRSWAALALLAFHIVWFHRRVLQDEARLEALFGDEYRRYKSRVKRWLPGVV